ncbi:hypothetical protein AO382_1884 [Moraxella catarrhalis]|uniref:Uncharacterized protein n=1 Tax=Moraxella catarrhalis TaxID=480 RepID=A0A7Z1A361_MORCA|nr:hypothetical protein AO382_1884 [Moraxella catarrhalis]
MYESLLYHKFTVRLCVFMSRWGTVLLNTWRSYRLGIALFGVVMVKFRFSLMQRHSADHNFHD